MSNTNKIADHYGYINQSWKLMEEVGELITAMAKFHQEENAGQAVENMDHVIEEIADVEVVLSQIKYFFNAESEVKKIKEQKIARQLERISKE